MNDYTNRENFAEDGLECLINEDCQLIFEHSGSCDPRREQERWAALHEAFRRIDMGQA